MELILAVIILGAFQTVLSTPAIYNNEINKNSYSNYKYKLYPDSLSIKTAWSSLSNSKKTYPIKSIQNTNDINKFPFNLNSEYSNNEEHQLNKVTNNIETKQVNLINAFKDANEDDSTSTDDYEDVTIVLTDEDLDDRIDPKLMCSLLGSC